MTQPDKLFALVQSLTPHEKAYFGKYSRLNAAKEKPDYLLLFEFLDKATSYDEVAIKKRFKGQKFVSHLSRKKTQLKEKIIESLSHYHASRTVEASLRLQMNVLPILHEKASKDKTLIKEFENQIKAIKKKAKEEECFGVLIDLFSWERLLLKLQDNNKQDDNVLSLLKSRETFQNILNKEHILEGAALRAELITLKDPKIQTSENRQKFQDSVISVIKNIDLSNLSTMSMRYYSYAKCAHYSYLNDWEAACNAAKNLINTYSKKETLDTTVLKQYKRHLCKYLVVCGQANKFDDYLDRIEEVRSMSSSDDDILLFNTIYFKMLVYHLTNYQFEAAIEVAKDIENRWDDLCDIIPKKRQLAYCYNFVVAYWFGGSIEMAEYWLSKIMNFENVNQGQRFITLSRIIQLPICYDAQYDSIENRIESTRKVLKKRKELNEYRQIILSGFRKLIRCINKQEKRECIADMQNKLIQIKNRQVTNPVDLECLILWCKLKIEKQKITTSKQMS